METDAPQRGRGSITRNGDAGRPGTDRVRTSDTEPGITHNERPTGQPLDATEVALDRALGDPGSMQLTQEDAADDYDLEAAALVADPPEAVNQAVLTPRDADALSAQEVDDRLLTGQDLAPAAAAARETSRAFPWIHFDDRAGRLLLSIVLAILLWVYVSSLDTQTTQFTDLTLDIRGIGPNLKPTIDPKTINATVQAPQNILSTFSKADIRPFLDLTGLREGVHTVPVQADILNGRASEISMNFNPSSVQVQLEPQASRIMSVTVQTLGTPTFGFGIEPAQVTPTQVKVTGPTEAVARVAKVIAQVDVDGKSGTQQGSKVPVALDSNNQEIQGVTFDPETVQVVVPLKLLLNYKAVPVRAPIVGQPAPGYRVSTINVDPTNVTVCCAPSLLEPLQFLNAEPIAITGTTSTVITTTNLILPKGVELYPGQPKQITVTVDVEVLQTTFQVSVAPTVEGLPDGWTAVVSPNKLDLTLAGTFEQSQNLSPADIRAVVNLSGKTAGTYELSPQVIVPQGIKLDQASPDVVTVTVIAPTPTATPTSTEVPTRTPTATNEVPLVVQSTPAPSQTPHPEETHTPTATPAGGSTATPTHAPTPVPPGGP